MRSPSRYLLVRHHLDGQWYEAGLLDQHRRPDGWWCVVQYRTRPGEQYVLAVPATSCRPLTEQQDDQADHAQTDVIRPTVSTRRPGHSCRGITAGKASGGPATASCPRPG